MTTIKVALSTIKEVRDLIGDDWREAVENMRDCEDDFQAGKYRFISRDAIQGILEEEISNDEYCLGCFNASFIAECTGWPLALIEAAQKGEAYEALGQAIIQEGYVAKMAEEYARQDGHGHHFASYDGHEHEIGPSFLAFRVD